MAETFDPDAYLAQKAAPQAQAFDPDKYLQEKSSTGPGDEIKGYADKVQSALGTIGKPVAAVGNFIDKYTGAPVRAGIGAAQEGENPLPAAWKQFGEDTSKAPTGTQLAQRAGIPDTPLFNTYETPKEGGLVQKSEVDKQLDKANESVPNKSTIAGAAIDTAANPINYIPGEKIAGLIGKGAEGAEEFANTKAFKGGGAMLKDFRTANAKGQVQKLGQFMRDNNILGAGDTVDSVAEKAAAFNKDAGQKLNDIYKNATEQMGQVGAQADASGFNPVRDKPAIMQAAKDALGDANGKSQLNALSDHLDQLAEKYGDKTLDPKAANDIKGVFDDEVNYSRNPLQKEPLKEQAYSAARKVVSSKINDQIDTLGKLSGSEDAAQALKDANQDYGMSAQIKRMATDKVQRESANRMFGLTDTIAGSGLAGAGLLAHGNAGAAAGMAAGAIGNKLARTYGNGLLSSSAGALADVADASKDIAPYVMKGADNDALIQQDQKKKNKKINPVIPQQQILTER